MDPAKHSQTKGTFSGDTQMSRNHFALHPPITLEKLLYEINLGLSYVSDIKFSHLFHETFLLQLDLNFGPNGVIFWRNCVPILGKFLFRFSLQHKHCINRFDDKMIRFYQIRYLLLAVFDIIWWGCLIQKFTQIFIDLQLLSSEILMILLILFRPPRLNCVLESINLFSQFLSIHIECN